jgi:hypothetical protein
MTPWAGAPQQAFPSLNYTAKMFRADLSQGTTCHSPAAAGAQTLALGAWGVNNDMNSGLCWAAMAWIIFWREYLSSADKQEGVGGSPQISLDLCTRIGCHGCYGYEPKCRISCSQNQVFPGPCRERTGEFSNCTLGLLQSLLGLLHKSYSDFAPFQEALGVLRVSHRGVLKFSLLHGWEWCTIFRPMKKLWMIHLYLKPNSKLNPNCNIHIKYMCI